MAVTLADVVETTRDYLIGDQRPTLNLLSATIDSSQTTLVLTYADGRLAKGAVLSIDLEMVYVIAWDAVGLVATVIRGHRGTTGAAHTSGAVVEINPRFPTARIGREIGNELTTLPEALYAPLTVKTTITAGERTLNLPSTLATAYGLLDVRWKRQGTVSGTSDIEWPRMKDCRIVAMPTSEFATGRMLVLGETAEIATDIVLIGAMPIAFGTPTLTTDLTLTPTFMPASWKDMIAIGVAVRMLAAQEPRRSDRTGQGESRRAEEVPPMSELQAALAIQRSLLDRRRKEEIQKLQIAYPMRIS